MNISKLVFRNQFAQFKREKGMLIFYGLSLVCIGIILPFFLHGAETLFTMAALFTALYLRPLLADSLAGEREHRTLEALLSSSVSGSSIAWGKLRFCLFFALAFFGLAVLSGTLISQLIGYPITFAAWQWFGVVAGALLSFCAISVAGVFASATSADLRSANSRISRSTYLLGFLYVVFLAVLVSAGFIPSLVVASVLALGYCCVIAIFALRIAKMKQSDFYENIKTKPVVKEHEQLSSHAAPKTPYETVLRFELKYFRTLKTLLLNFGVLCVCPALLTLSIALLIGGAMDLNYAVLVTVLMIPRVPVNLIAHSVGGEKVYKTGESLLSTPLRIGLIFLAKCSTPILVSVVMLVLAAVVTLAFTGIAAWVAPGLAPVNGYNVSQLVLLFPVSIMISVLMMFLSALFSVVMKTPRQGLYVNTIISSTFVLPVVAILYLTQQVLLWSLVYLAVLLVGSALCVMIISRNITRPQIMARL